MANENTEVTQTELVKVDSQSTSFFRWGGRPAAIWVCVLGLFYSFIINPIVPWILSLFVHDVKPMPTLDSGMLFTLLGGLLGLGGMRTFEKSKGIN
jgi:hypothetical protein